jgi:hypothetical protein
MTTLEEFAAGNYLSFKYKNPIEGKYLGYVVEDDPFKKGETRVRFSLVVDGEEKNLSSKSKRLVKAIMKANVKEGDTISIQRFGEAFETNFEVRNLTGEVKTEVAEDAAPVETKTKKG